MGRYFILLFLFSIILIHVSCGVDCSKVDCASPGGTLRVKVLKDGKNALYGTNHEINHDSVKLYVPITDTSSYNIVIGFDTSSQTIRLNLTEGVNYILKIDTLQNDTFEVFTVFTGMDDCCKNYLLSSAKKNGQPLCQDGCNEIVELQL